MVKNYRRKKSQCVLEVNENRIILSNPQIQPFNEYKYESKEDIMHFYYDLEIQFDRNYWKRMLNKEGSCKKKRKRDWVSVAKGNVYEFGAIVALEECINEIISIDLKKKKDRQYFCNDFDDKEQTETDFEVFHEISCTGMLEEDSYVLKKNLRHFDSVYDEKTDQYISKDIEWYGIYIGIGSESKSNTMGFSCTDLTEDELLIIKAWAEDFLAMAKETTKKHIKKMFKEQGTDNVYSVGWFKEHMKKNYPEDYGKWKEIWIKLYQESFILEEYFNYVKGKEIEEPLFSKWEEDKVVAQELIKGGMKDWEAYCKMIDFYRDHR